MDLREIILKMKNDSPDNFDTLISGMKKRASEGKIPGVTPKMIDDECDSLFNTISEGDVPADIMQLFLESEDAIQAYFKDDDIRLSSNAINESYFYNNDTKEESLNLDVTIESILGEMGGQSDTI